jgi:hypothetical protein
MVANQPNWTPVPRAPEVKVGVPLCGRCHHPARAHHDATSCSVRRRWLLRCKYTGYTRPEAAAPGA